MEKIQFFRKYFCFFEKSYLENQQPMNTQAISCHNCLSRKRQFYVYLECRHFLCLTCCLCIANLQNLTIRCCHTYTKMSQQLSKTMFQEVHKRKDLKKAQKSNLGQNIDQNPSNFGKLVDSHELQINKKVKGFPLYSQEMFSPQEKRNDEKQTLKCLQNPPKQRRNRTKNTEVSRMLHYFENCKQNQTGLTKKDQNSCQLPTFQNLMQKETLKAREQVKIDINKRVYYFQNSQQCKANNDSKFASKDGNIKNRQVESYNSGCGHSLVTRRNEATVNDRIMAKLAHHQEKMNRLIRQHHL